MALPPLAMPLGPAIRFLIKYGADLTLGAWTLYEDFFDQHGHSVAAPEWRRITWEYSRATPAGTVEDRAQFGMDVLNLTDGSIDSSWTTADNNAVVAIATAFAIAIKPLMSTTSSLQRITLRSRQFAEPITPEQRFKPSGPPTKIDVSVLAGTSTGDALPYQVAMSCTLKTAVPKHWGRFYLPCLTEDLVTSNGRFDTADVGIAATALGTMLNSLWDAQFPAVVASTQITTGPAGSEPLYEGTLLGVVAGQVDDIPDVIRRRRARTAAVRNIVAVT